MAGYIIVDVKTRKILIPCVILALFLFVIGIIIGYFSAPRRTSKTSTSTTCSLTEAVTSSCPVDSFTDIGKRYFKRLVYDLFSSSGMYGLFTVFVRLAYQIP